MEKFPKQTPAHTTSQPVYINWPMDHSSEREITSPLSLPPPQEFVSFSKVRELHSAPGLNGDVPQLLGGSEEEYSDLWEDSDEEDWMEEINDMIPSQLYAKILKEKKKKHNSDSDDETTRYASFSVCRSNLPYSILLS